MFEWHLSPEIAAAAAEYYVSSLIHGSTFDLVFVDNGSLISYSLLRKLKKRAALIINYNHDDPFGHRDGVRFRVYRRSVPEYDHIIVVRAANVEEAKCLGAKSVHRRFMTFDRVAHAPLKLTKAIVSAWSTRVAFVGTWMPERGPFLRKLVRAGIPLTIFGGGWDRSPELAELRPSIRHGHLEGEQYNYAIQCAQISIGLLSKGNRDLHTTRSFEIPYLGGLLCAERTSDHEEIFQHEIDCLLWRNVDECIDLCKSHLADPELCNQLALRGRNLVESGKFSNDDLIEAVVGLMK